MIADAALARHCLSADHLGKSGFHCPILKQRTMLMNAPKHEEGWDPEGDSREDCHGLSPLARMEHMLDVVVNDFMEDGLRKKEKARLRGVIYGLSFSIALVKNPYYIDQDAVTQAAWERWQARQEDD